MTAKQNNSDKSLLIQKWVLLKMEQKISIYLNNTSHKPLDCGKEGEVVLSLKRYTVQQEVKMLFFLHENKG